MKRRIYEILEVARPGDGASRFFDLALVSLILLNILAVILDSVPAYNARFGDWFHAFEVFSVAVFTVEYLLRLWTSTFIPRFARPLTGRLRYAATPLAIFDLLAILPFYLAFLPLDLRVLRIFRIARVLRILKLAHYSETLRSLVRVVAGKKEELVLSMTFLVMLLVVASSMMYFAEHEAQPAVFSSIPAAMWWGIATLTTVGYGDAVPVTDIGRLLGAVIAVLGIGMFALPTGILGSGFMEEMQRRKSGQAVCPHCGKTLK